MMAFVRTARNGGIITPDSPMIILGDMNLVGLAQQQRTLLTGDIVDENRFGSDFAPDGDGSALADLKPPVTGLPMFFTWYNSQSPFSPGRLDYIVYTDSVLEPGNRFVLFTPTLSNQTRAAFGLAPTARAPIPGRPVTGEAGR